jgi:predicted dehydrogenase
MFDVNAAVVGAGFIGPVHAEGLRRAGVSVVGILGVDAAESTRAADQLGIPKAYRSFDEVLSDRSVHSVHLAVPNRFHFEMARAAIRAGKHVMCEKPLAMRSTESAELVALAASAKVAAGVNYNLRFYPLCQDAAARVRSGAIGEVHHVCGSYVQDWLLLETDYNWRVLGDEGGALRAVADIGTHWLDLVHAVTGLEVEALCADLKTVFPVRKRPKGEVETFSGKAGPPKSTEDVAIDTEDYGAVLLRFRGGARGLLWVSQVTAGRKNCLRFEIAGAKQALAWCSEQPEEMWIGRRGAANELLMRDPSLLSERARPWTNHPGGHAEGFPDTFKQLFKAFYGAIAAGDLRSPAFPSFADGHREIVLCEAILESHRGGRWIEIGGRR